MRHVEVIRLRAGGGSFGPNQLLDVFFAPGDQVVIIADPNNLGDLIELVVEVRVNDGRELYCPLLASDMRKASLSSSIKQNSVSMFCFEKRSSIHLYRQVIGIPLVY